MSAKKEDYTAAALGFAPAQLWACPVTAHGLVMAAAGLDGDQGPVPAVEVDPNGVAYCTYHGCGRNSENEQGCNCDGEGPRGVTCIGQCCGVGQCSCTPPEIVRFDEDSDQVGILISVAGDDELFWQMVTRDALDYDYDYGIDEVAATARLLQEDGQSYDESAVNAWLRVNVTAPQWRWYQFVDDENYQEGQRLVPADPSDQGAFNGAIIAVKDDPR